MRKAFFTCFALALFICQECVSLEGEAHFRDGTTLSCQLTEIPPLHFSFGTIELKPELVSTIAFPPSGKIEVVTREGELYIAKHPSNPLRFDFQGLLREFSADEIVEVYLQPIELNSRSPSSYALTLVGGDQVPVELVGRDILVSNGWDDFRINPLTLEGFSYDGCLHGCGIDQYGQVRVLTSAFLKDPYLFVQVKNAPYFLKFPWNKIAALNKGHRETEVFEIVKEKPSPEIPLELEPLDESFSISWVDLDPEPFDGFESIIEPLSYDFEEPAESDLFTDTESFDTSYSHLIALSDERVAFPDWIVELTEDHQIESTDEGEKVSLEEIQLDYPLDQEEPFVEEDDLSIGGDPFVEEEKLTPIETGLESIVKLNIEPSNSSSEKVFVQPKGLSKPGFYVSPRKVTNGDYAKFVDETRYTPPSHWIGGKIPPGRDQAPVVNVSYKDALVYSVWSGQRLPSSEEWERALEQADSFQDIDDSIYEWTTTPHIISRDGSRQPTTFGRKGSGTRRIVRSPLHKDSAALSNFDSNSQTGFRCISDHE